MRKKTNFTPQDDKSVRSLVSLRPDLAPFVRVIFTGLGSPPLSMVLQGERRVEVVKRPGLPQREVHTEDSYKDVADLVRSLFPCRTQLERAHFKGATGGNRESWLARPKLLLWTTHYKQQTPSKGLQATRRNSILL